MQRIVLDGAVVVMDAARDEIAAGCAKGVPPKGDLQEEAKAMAMGSSRASDVTTIDVLLEPDALKLFPKGFALDATHNPHITLIQRFVRTGDLDKVYAALN